MSKVIQFVILKVLKTTPSFNGDFMCEVALPNREISLVYNKEILQRLENLIPPVHGNFHSGGHLLRRQRSIESADSDIADAVRELLRHCRRELLSRLYVGPVCLDERRFLDL